MTYCMCSACGNCPTVLEDCRKPQCVTTDGVERAIFTVNRRIPAPSIQVCQGDTIVVDVKNELHGHSTTIHWHGLHQKQSPWMDGVPMITQCPILESQIFRYSFLAEEQGTHFYHSHDGLQKVDGIVGALIVREPNSTNPLRNLFDFDLPSHVLVLQDWFHTLSENKLPGLRLTDIGQSPNAYLIKGKGINFNTSETSAQTPMAYFQVEAGARYRFRVVAGTCLSCPLRISFQGHRVKVISADVFALQPQGPFDSVIMSAGERFDLLVVTDQPVAQYWILVQGMGACQATRQLGVLQYKGATAVPQPPANQYGSPIGYAFNTFSGPCNSSNQDGLCFSQARSLLRNPKRISALPDSQIVMDLGFYFYTLNELFETGTYKKHNVPLPTTLFAGLMNNISNIMPPSPLLTQYDDVPPELFCTNQPITDPGVRMCINLIRLRQGGLIEFIVSSTINCDTPGPVGPIIRTHPFHLHGYTFYVVEQGLLPRPCTQGLQTVVAQLKAKRRVINEFLPSKDTITIPQGGYAVIRIHADNPGFWFCHCHFAYHAYAGMTAVFQVGRSYRSDIPRDFPECHQYLPDFRLQ